MKGSTIITFNHGFFDLLNRFGLLEGVEDLHQWYHGLEMILDFSW